MLKNIYNNFRAARINKDDKTKKNITSYANGGYLEVEGWGVDKELIELISTLDNFQKDENIYGPLWEIGVHHGRTLILFGMLARDNEPIIGVDLFEDAQEQNLDLSGSGSYTSLMKNLNKFTPDVTYDIYTANSFYLENEIIDKITNARLCHIDGGHTLEVVMNDLSIAQSTIGEGGIIIIDDYLHSGFPEVQEAVHKFFNRSTNIRAIPFGIGKNKLFLINIIYHKKIMRYLNDILSDSRNKNVKVMGYDSFCVDPH